MRERSATAIVVGLLTVLLVGVCGAALMWRLGGGRWFAVATPSMGRAAPVGTLLLTRPATVSSVRPGDIVTFRPPGAAGEVYSHRVATVSPSGLRTRGDVNGSLDPWTIGDSDLIGKVVHRWWGIGWVLRGLPLLLLCLGITALLAAGTRARWRSAVRVVGAAASASVVAWVLHPWVGLVRLSADPAPGGVAVRAISTGILPTKAQAVLGGTHVRLVNGQVGTVMVTAVDRNGVYRVTGSPSLSLWWWVAVVLICAAPLLWCLTVGLAPLPSSEPDGR